MLCEYSNIFGKVGEGVHSYRIFNIAIVDVLFIIFGAFAINLFLPRYSFILILCIIFVVGILMHRLFCVRTTIDKLLFT